jgi:aspartate racemase
MKTIGLIGGMSWQSTLPYYRTINERIAERLGGLHSARCVLYSVDFADVEELQSSGDWITAGRRMAEAALAIERAGADFVVLCTNTMHKVADAIEAAVKIPLLHIADATGERVRAAGFQKIGLLGTRYTMEDDFYRGRLESRFGLDVVVPSAPQRQRVHDIIYDDLCRGVTSGAADLRAIADALIEDGARGVILGCTELGLAIKPEMSAVPLFDTAVIHAEAAADFALAPPTATG